MSAAASATSKPATSWSMAIGAIGVVYGDIGTSPLYAFREAMVAVSGEGIAPARDDVFGILSLILWTLTIIVTIKYVTLLLRIDNRGEGGTLALMALARSVIYRNTTGFLFLGIMGAALFYGDSIITPAISVLSAVEGVKVVAPGFEPFIIPVTIAIIVGLFYFQSKGTASVSKLFGPITVLWFLTMGMMGLAHVMQHPAVLAAFNPYYGLKFVFTHGGAALVVLGAIFLCVTGAEALYADLGHFGRRPIQLAWGWFIFPMLTLNYLGQGALILDHPEALENPFFHMVGPALQVPLVALATCATIIASQAVITGAYSLTQQAINLGLLPRLTIRHTSDVHSGQIYMPQINYMLMACVIILVVIFQSSSNLAATYGISVTGAMVVDAIMAFFVIWQVWEWPLAKTMLLVGPFFIIETIFLGSNLLKVADGGWVPLTLATLMTGLMLIWIRGSFILNGRARKRDPKVEKFMKEYTSKYSDVKRVPGTAFFLTSDPAFMPPSLIQNMRHNHILHDKNVILSIKAETIPYVDQENRLIVTALNKDFTLLVMRFGFKEMPDVQRELLRLNRDRALGIDFDWENTSLFLSRKVLRAHSRYGMPAWQDWIYLWLTRNATEPTDYYRLPVRRVIEIGRHVVI